MEAVSCSKFITDNLSWIIGFWLPVILPRQRVSCDDTFVAYDTLDITLFILNTNYHHHHHHPVDPFDIYISCSVLTKDAVASPVPILRKWRRWRNMKESLDSRMSDWIIRRLIGWEPPAHGEITTENGTVWIRLTGRRFLKIWLRPLPGRWRWSFNLGSLLDFGGLVGRNS